MHNLRGAVRSARGPTFPAYDKSWYDHGDNHGGRGLAGRPGGSGGEPAEAAAAPVLSLSMRT